jgi:bifunctional non-homologous end joining protein LigD
MMAVQPTDAVIKNRPSRLSHRRAPNRYNKCLLPTIIPAKFTKSLSPFDYPAWLFELKHDSFRSLAYVEDGRCSLVSRHRNVYKSFDRLREALAKLKAKDATPNGEIVCLDENG